jgi:hypothetical protein
MTNNKTKDETAAETPVEKPVELDLASLDTIAASDKGADIVILHPITKDPIGIFVTVLGKHSEAFRELVKERSNKRIREDSLNARRGKFGKIKTAEEYEAEAIEMLCACTLGWGKCTVDKDGNIAEKTGDTMLFDGEQLPWNVGNGQKVYRRMIWLRQQVDDGIGDLENFMKA